MFSTLTVAERAEIDGIGQWYRAPRACDVLVQGTPGKGLYAILRGDCVCRIRLFQGDETVIAHLHSGEVFGEMSLIDSEPVSATVTTVEECALFHVPKVAFDELRAAMRPAAFKILRALGPTICARLRAINNRIGDIFTAPERHQRIMRERSKDAAGDAPREDATHDD